MAIVLERNTDGSDPLSAAELRDFARISSTAEDGLIESLATAARHWVEDLSGRTLSSSVTTWKLYMDDFPSGDILLPRPPVTAVSSVSYEDEDGSTQTWSSAEYQTDMKSNPARLCYVEGGAYPSTQASTFNTVTITYTAGYTSASAVPPDLLLAIRMLVAHWYEKRLPVAAANEGRYSVPHSLLSLVRRNRVWSI